MKNGKLPTRQQKILLVSNGLIPDNWLIVKDFLTELEIVSRNELKKVSIRKAKTRIIKKPVSNRR